MTATEKNVGTLVFPNEYLHQLNSIAGVTSQNVIFLKRKFVSKEGWELIKYPLTDCSRFEYRNELPILKIILGVLLLGLVLFAGVMVAIYWDDLEPGTRVPVGLIGLAGIYGAKVAFGGRRHRLDVTLNDGSKLTWKSKAGERKIMASVVDGIVEFLRSQGRM